MDPITLGLVGVAALSGLTYAARRFRTINEKQEAIVQRFGSYRRTLRTGLRILQPGEKIVGRVDMRQQQVDINVEVMTRDKLFVKLPTHIMYAVTDSKSAFYELKDPVKQITDYALNVIRTKASSMSLQELTEAQHDLGIAVEKDAGEKMRSFGYEIRNVLVDQPEPSDETKRSLEAVTNSQLRLKAADNESLIMQKMAEGEGEKNKILETKAGEGVAAMRDRIVEGLVRNLQQLEAANRSAEQADLILSQALRMDTLRDIGRQGNLCVVDLNTGVGNSGQGIDATAATLTAALTKLQAARPANSDHPARAAVPGQS